MQQHITPADGSRRRFLKTGAGALAALTLPGSLAIAAPKRGGRLRQGFGGGSTTDTLDPGTITDFFMQTLSATIRNELTEINHKNEVVPSLAESWESNDTATKWRFKIRRNVEFHNGRTLKPQDVVASMNHHRGDTKSAAKPYFADVDTIAVDGDYVVFTLNAGNADFPFLMSDYHIGICQGNADGTMDWQSGIGSGSYVLKDFEPGVRAFTSRHPNYWKGDTRAHFDEVEWLGISDVTARTNALTTGEIDIMNRCDLKTVHLLARNPDINILNITGTQHYTAPMITTNAPFNNNDVRLALKYALDREELVQKILRGYGVVGNDHPIAPANRYFAKDLEQRVFDPDKAKFHLKKAGESNLKVRLSAADAAFEGAVDTAVLWSESAKKCGIDIEVVREPNDGYWSNVWLKKDWSMCFWGGRPTEDLMFTVAYSKGAAWNDSYWDHDRFNKLLSQARAELNDSKRREIYTEMQGIVRDEGGVPTMMYANYVSGLSKKVANDGNIAINWDLDGYKNAERWWFEG